MKSVEENEKLQILFNPFHVIIEKNSYERRRKEPMLGYMSRKTMKKRIQDEKINMNAWCGTC